MSDNEGMCINGFDRTEIESTEEYQKNNPNMKNLLHDSSSSSSSSLLLLESGIVLLISAILFQCQKGNKITTHNILKGYTTRQNTQTHSETENEKLRRQSR